MVAETILGKCFLKLDKTFFMSGGPNKFDTLLKELVDGSGQVRTFWDESSVIIDQAHEHFNVMRILGRTNSLDGLYFFFVRA